MCDMICLGENRKVYYKLFRYEFVINNIANTKTVPCDLEQVTCIMLSCFKINEVLSCIQTIVKRERDLDASVIIVYIMDVSSLCFSCCLHIVLELHSVMCKGATNLG